MNHIKQLLLLATMLIITTPVLAQQSELSIRSPVVTCQPRSTMLIEMEQKEMMPFVQGTGLMITMTQDDSDIISTSGITEIFVNTEDDIYMAWLTIENDEGWVSCLMLAGAQFGRHGQPFISRENLPQA